jgi:hypothetical protein
LRKGQPSLLSRRVARDAVGIVYGLTLRVMLSRTA